MCNPVPVSRWSRLRALVEESHRRIGRAARDALRHDAALITESEYAVECDDAIVDVVASRRPDPVYVVTADRQLRERVRALGARVLGPKSLLDAPSFGAEPAG